ncbi:MAG: hypothetical protein ABW044_11195 [Cellvibrio sp.]
MNINLHIERLVLDGLAITPNQRQLLQASVEAELTRLLSEGGLHSQLNEGLSVPRLNAPQINIHSGMSSANLGQQIAASVYQNIGQQGIDSGSKRS